jgi:DNA polymerase elongation subunit (family B)
MLPKDFYDNVEVPGSLKHIIYSDTDSLFILIPDKTAINKTTEEKMKVADKVAEEINDAVIKYLNEYFLPKSNISIDQNSTFFKSELLMDSLMMLDVKKNYAFKVLAKKGRVFKTPKIEYVGIAVIKSNVAPLTQDFLKTLIDDIILNPEILDKDRIKKVSEIASLYFTKFIQHCEELDFNYIAFPGKWSKASQIINGMMLYNFIMGKEVFAQGSAGNFIYCTFKNIKLFEKAGIDITKLNGICIPSKYDIEDLKIKFSNFGISIDKDTQWETLYITTIQRVISLVKKGE